MIVTKISNPYCSIVEMTHSDVEYGIQTGASKAPPWQLICIITPTVIIIIACINIITTCICLIINCIPLLFRSASMHVVECSSFQCMHSKGAYPLGCSVPKRLISRRRPLPGNQFDRLDISWRSSSRPMIPVAR